MRRLRPVGEGGECGQIKIRSACVDKLICGHPVEWPLIHSHVHPVWFSVGGTFFQLANNKSPTRGTVACPKNGSMDSVHGPPVPLDTPPPVALRGRHRNTSTCR